MSDQNKIEIEATQWMARQLSGDMSPEEQHRFEQWLDQPSHRGAFEQLQLAAASTDEYAEDLLAEAFENELHELDAAQTRTFAWPAIAAIAATIAITSGAMFYTMKPAAIEELQFATAVGQQQVVTLSDGTTATLNTATDMDVRYEADRRYVSLHSGEIFLDVQRNAERPFYVDAGNGQVMVTGTSFSVRRTAGETTVSVLSGAVDVTPTNAETATLLAGDGITISDEGVDQYRFDATEAFSWRSGRVRFKDTPLSDVTVELNRYLVVPIQLSPEVQSDTPLTGEFDVTDPALVVRGLTTALSLEAVRESDHILLTAGEEGG